MLCNARCTLPSIHRPQFALRPPANWCSRSSGPIVPKFAQGIHNCVICFVSKYGDNRISIDGDPTSTFLFRRVLGGSHHTRTAPVACSGALHTLSRSSSDTNSTPDSATLFPTMLGGAPFVVTRCYHCGHGERETTAPGDRHECARCVHGCGLPQCPPSGWLLHQTRV